VKGALVRHSICEDEYLAGFSIREQWKPEMVSHPQRDTYTAAQA